MFDIFNLPTGEGATDESNKRLFQSLKQSTKANNELISYQQSAANDTKVILKLQKLQTKTIMKLTKDFGTFLTIMKDNASSVKYEKISPTKKEDSPIQTGSSSKAKVSSSGSRFRMPTFIAGSLGTMKGLLGKAGLLGIVYGMVDGFSKAGDYFNTQFPTITERISSGIGRAAELITFGFIDAEKAARKMKKSWEIISSAFDDMLHWITNSDWYKGLKKTASNLLNSRPVKSITESDIGKWFKETGKQWYDYWLGNDKKKLNSGRQDLNLSAYMASNGQYKVTGKAHQLAPYTRVTILPDGRAKIGGSKSWRNNNPGNLSALGGLKYGATGIAITSTGDRGDQKQLIFNTPEEGIKAFDEHVARYYSKGSIEKEFYRYQSDKKAYRAKMAAMRRAGIDTTRSIGWYKQNDPEKYKKFREIMFRYEGWKPGKVVNVDYLQRKYNRTPKDEMTEANPTPGQVGENVIRKMVEKRHNSSKTTILPQQTVAANPRSLDTYNLDVDAVIEFKTRVGVE